ncbi:MAG: tRNA (adenosine(37)-N6)-threonylcarbamoyltransferase complex dimerization subunit type 1 TsaB [Pseudomonadota bacterium]
MIVLGIDTGGGACSVALTRDGHPLQWSSAPMRHGHAEHLVPEIERVLAECGLKPSALGLIGVTVGPGAFTGLRVGLAAAGGLALATGAPIVGVSSFDAVSAMCRPLKPEERRAVVIDSRRAEPFFQLFDAKGTAGQAGWHSIPTIVDRLREADVTLLAGDGAPAIASALGDNSIIVEAEGPIDPQAVCRLALERADQGTADPPAPAYLRPPDARLPAAR